MDQRLNDTKRKTHRSINFAVVSKTVDLFGSTRLSSFCIGSLARQRMLDGVSYEINRSSELQCLGCA